MPATATDRRHFLLTLAASGMLLPTLGYAQAAGGRHYLSGRTDDDGRHFLAALDAGGELLFEQPLPGRGHSIAASPDRKRAIAFARRPGRFALVIDLGSGTPLRNVASTDGRHFYGHGVYSPDGRYLFTPENDFPAGRGVIGVRDARDGYRHIGEMDAHGIGPHDLRLLDDGRTLAVAVGGILTHPDMGRHKLNLPTMAPSLAYIDTRDGSLHDEVRLAPELHQLSIRHLDVGAGNLVAAAMQYQGPQGDLVPLVALHRPGGGLVPLEAPEAITRRMRNYCGSVVFDAGKTIVGVTSPRGNISTFWHAIDGRLISYVEVTDGCGIAATGRAGEFLISSGTGAVFTYDVPSGTRTRIDTGAASRGHWDNHMVPVG